MSGYFPGILSNGALVPGLTAATVRTTLGLGTADSPTFAGGTFSGKIRSNAPVVGNATGAVGAGGPNLELVYNNYGFGVNTNGEVVVLINGTSTVRLGMGVVLASGQAIQFSSANNVGMASIPDLSLHRGGPGILSQRNGTNGQILEVTKTFTSATSNERFCIDALSDAANHRLVVARGSLGGAERGLQIGAMQDGGAFVPWLSFSTAGAATFHFNPSFLGASFSSTITSTNIINIRRTGSLSCFQVGTVGDPGTFHRFQVLADGSIRFSFGAIASFVGLIQSNDGVLEINNGTSGTLRDLALRNLFAASLPTSDPAVAGQVWRSGNDLKISTG